MERPQTDWSSHHHTVPEGSAAAASADAHPTRLLRTTDAKPTAPRLQDLFPRETRAIDRVITFWDPGLTWHANALDDLRGAGVGELGATRLVQADGHQTFALIRHVLLESDDGKLNAFLYVQAHAGEASSADVALMLLERSDFAVILTGGAAEHRDLPKRLQDFCRQAAWRGPLVQILAPQDKPSRGDRLRKTSWPRSLKVQVQDWQQNDTPGWLILLVERVAQGLSFPTILRPNLPIEDGAVAARSATLAIPPIVFDTPVPAIHVPKKLTPQGPVPLRPDAEVCAQALSVAALTPGATAAVVIDAFAERTLASQGDEAYAETAARSALHWWSGYADNDEAPLNELIWSVGPLQHIVLPVNNHPGLLLMSVVDRQLGDVSRARWQLSVACNEFA